MLLRYWRLILFILVIVGLIGAVVWSVNKFIFKGKIGGGETKTYQVLVAVYDEKNSDPIEDKKSSMKKGYVIGVYDASHEWSQTEKVSYLILKMKLNDKEMSKLTVPVEKEIDIKSLPEEQQKLMKEEKDSPSQKETISARAYKIDLEEIKFTDPNSLLSGQPFGDKVFDWGIVKKTD